MEKKTIYRYVFLTLCVILISVLLPYLISAVSGYMADRIAGKEKQPEVVQETEEVIPDGTYQVGDPSQYAGDHETVASMTVEEEKQYQKYQDMVQDYQSYLKEFTREIVKADSLKAGEMEKFISYNADQFYESAATYAYSAWGTDRTIRQIRFDSIKSYTDDNGDEVIQAMVEFLHTSHPDTEEGTQVVCIYYKNQGYYYFP